MWKYVSKYDTIFWLIIGLGLAIGLNNLPLPQDDYSRIVRLCLNFGIGFLCWYVAHKLTGKTSTAVAYGFWGIFTLINIFVVITLIYKVIKYVNPVEVVTYDDGQVGIHQSEEDDDYDYEEDPKKDDIDALRKELADLQRQKEVIELKKQIQELKDQIG